MPSTLRRPSVFGVSSPTHQHTTRRALEGSAKRKYFEHAGALLTADGTEDDLIKLEDVPKGEKFSF